MIDHLLFSVFVVVVVVVVVSNGTNDIASK